MKADPTFLYTWTRLNDSLPSPLFDNLLSLSSTTFCVKKKKGRRRNTGIVIEHADMIISRIMTYIMWITWMMIFFYFSCWLLGFLLLVVVIPFSCYRRSSIEVFWGCFACIGLFVFFFLHWLQVRSMTARKKVSSSSLRYVCRMTARMSIFKFISRLLEFLHLCLKFSVADCS